MPNLVGTLSWTPGLQNDEKYISVAKSPSVVFCYGAEPAATRFFCISTFETFSSGNNDFSYFLILYLLLLFLALGPTT